MNKFFNYTDVKELIPKKPLTANKYDFGNILLIGGDVGLEGAIMLSAESALKSGVGMINLYLLSARIEHILQKRPEFMTLSKINDLNKFEDKKFTIVAGPGTKNFNEVVRILKKINNEYLDIVLDASCIEILKTNLILEKPIITPHEGEAARLLDIKTNMISKHREKYAIEISNNFNVITVLKGNKTIISDGVNTFTCKDGNSSLAFAGSGDILSGLIGSFLAQGLNKIDSCMLGVSIHAFAAENSNYKRGITANDLINFIRDEMYFKK